MWRRSTTQQHQGNSRGAASIRFSPDIRALVRERLEWAGLKLDGSRHRQLVGVEGQISSDESSLHQFAVPTDEELLITRDTGRCILGEPLPLHAEQISKVEEVRIQ